MGTTTNTTTNTTSGLAIDYDDDEEGDLFGNNSKKARMTMEYYPSMEMELHRINGNEIITKESKDAKRPKNQPNNPNKRTKISDKSEVELHRTNDNEIITKESNDAKTRPKRTKISDKSKLDEINAIETADDIGQNPSTSETSKAKSK